eukprot:1295001-Pyramimonas_sp.AAC.1
MRGALETSQEVPARHLLRRAELCGTYHDTSAWEPESTSEALTKLCRNASRTLEPLSLIHI